MTSHPTVVVSVPTMATSNFNSTVVWCTPDVWTNPQWLKLFGREPWVNRFYIFAGVFIIPRSWDHPPPFFSNWKPSPWKIYYTGRFSSQLQIILSVLEKASMTNDMSCLFQCYERSVDPICVVFSRFFLNCFEVDGDQIILNMFLYV